MAEERQNIVADFTNEMRGKTVVAYFCKLMAR
jgi:hypothetical protein